MNLTDLEKGCYADILEVTESHLAGKLKEFGIFGGCRVKMLGSAPSGSPLIIEAGGMKIGLRKDDASRVNIQKS